MRNSTVIGGSKGVLHLVIELVLIVHLEISLRVCNVSMAAERSSGTNVRARLKRLLGAIGATSNIQRPRAGITIPKKNCSWRLIGRSIFLDLHIKGLIAGNLRARIPVNIDIVFVVFGLELIGPRARPFLAKHRCPRARAFYFFRCINGAVNLIARFRDSVTQMSGYLHRTLKWS